VIVRWAVSLIAVVVWLAACGGARVGPDRGHGTAGLEGELARIPASPDVRGTLARSRLLRALGRQEVALAELAVATDAARERLDWAALSALWREVGDVRLEQGRPQDALEAFGKRLKTAVSLDQRIEHARALVDTAYAFALMGSMSRADEALGAASLLAGAPLTSDPLTAERMALTRERLHDPERATELLAVAQRGYQAQGDATGAARAAVYLARLEAERRGDAAPLDAALAAASASQDPEPRARLLRYRAEAGWRKARYEPCRKDAEEAVRLADRRGLSAVAKLARVALARCAADAGHLDVAIRSAEEAGFLAEEHRQHLTGERARQEAGFEAFLIYRLLLSLQVKLPEPRRAAAAFVTSERARARAHLDAVLRGRASSAGPLGEVSPVLLRDQGVAEEQVRLLTRELASQRRQPGLAEKHRNALWALEDIKEAISQDNQLAARIAIPRPATLAQVREALVGKDALLVSYFVTDAQVIAIAIDATTEKLWTLASPPEALTKMVRAFRKDVLLDPSRGQPEVARAAARLYQELLGPLDAAVAAHRRLIVIPHGDLAALPFETLVDPRGKFLVETHEVSYALSATLAVELAKRAPPAVPMRPFVGLGDPVYDWEAFKAGRAEGAPGAARGEAARGLTLWVDAAAVAPASATASAAKSAPGGLTRLPGTGNELRSIAKLFGGRARIHLREQATEQAVKAGALSGHRIVHVASHGLLEPHYQALALTLDPDSKEDGFLLHSEIVDLKLDCDLVVLSACHTGNTRLRTAEPVAGLTLALRRAGAGRVVVSLWAVDDDATARLMTDFYRPLVDSADYDRALADAKRQMISKGSHPYFWAPFVLIR
jgi:CHAT domain-containing protein